MGYLHNQNTISTKVGPALLANYLACLVEGPWVKTKEHIQFNQIQFY